jgi:AIPR protein
MDGYDYPCRESPCTTTLRVERYAKQDLPSHFAVHQIYVKCQEVREKLLPLDANLRDPTRTEQVQDMQRCLEETPGDFYKLNNGMTILSRSVTHNPQTGEVAIEFAERDGVCNGGHTYFALVTAPFEIDPVALVHMEVLQLPPTLAPEDRLQVVRRIARARNNNNALSLRSEADYLDYYHQFKERIDPTWVIWKDGDRNAADQAIDAEHFIRLLVCLDPKRFYHPTWNPRAKRHGAAVTGVRSIHNKWFEEMEDYQSAQIGPPPLKHMAVLSKDMFGIRDLIAKSLLVDDGYSAGFRRSLLYRFLAPGRPPKEVPLLTNPEVAGAALPATAEVLLVGLFRTDVWLHPDAQSGAVDLIGWYLPPDELWDVSKKTLMDRLVGYFTDDSSSDPKRFIRANAPYDCDLFTIGSGQTPPPPRIIYETTSGARFISVDAATVANATHALDVPASPALAPLSTRRPRTGLPLYRAA